MSISIITNFKVNTYEPIDDRLVATNSSALSTIPFPYEGLTVYTKQEKLNYTYNGQSWQVSSNGIYGGSGSLVGDTDINTGVVLSNLNNISNDFILSASSSNDSRVKYITRFRRNVNDGLDYKTVEVLNQIRYLDYFSGDLQGPYISFNKQDIKKGIISFGTPTRNIQNNIVVERLRIEPDSTSNQGAIVLSPGTYSPPFYFSQMSNGDAFLGFNWDGTNRINTATGSSEIRFNGGRIQFLNGGITPTNQQFLINEPNSQNNSDILLRVDTSSRDMDPNITRNFQLLSPLNMIRNIEHRYTKLQSLNYKILTHNTGDILYLDGNANFYLINITTDKSSSFSLTDLQVRRGNSIIDLPDGTEIIIRFYYTEAVIINSTIKVNNSKIVSHWHDISDGSDNFIQIKDKPEGDIFTFRRGGGSWYITNINRESEIKDMISTGVKWDSDFLDFSTVKRVVVGPGTYQWQNLVHSNLSQSINTIESPFQIPYKDGIFTSSDFLQSPPIQIGKDSFNNVYLRGSFRITGINNNQFSSINKIWFTKITDESYFPTNDESSINYNTDWGLCEVIIRGGAPDMTITTTGRISADSGGRIFLQFRIGILNSGTYLIDVNIPQFSWKTV